MGKADFLINPPYLCYNSRALVHRGTACFSTLASVFVLRWPHWALLGSSLPLLQVPSAFLPLPFLGFALCLLLVWVVLSAGPFCYLCH